MGEDPIFIQIVTCYSTNMARLFRPRVNGSWLFCNPLVLTLFLTGNALASTVTWSGGGDGISWSDPANWSGGVLPGPLDDVTIAGASGSVRLDLSNTSVRSLQCDRGFILGGGSLSLGAGTSAINGAFNMVPGTWVSAAGSGSSLTCSDTVSIDGASLYASSGATVTLMGVSQVVRTNGLDVVWQADGVGSRIVLANVTSVVGFSDGGWWRFHSSDGGQVDLPSLQTVTNGWFDVWTTGTNSSVNLSALTGYQPGNQNQILDLEADYGGTVQIPALAALNHVGLTLRGPGSSVPLAQVSNVDNANLLATDGAVLALPGITQVTRTNGFDALWEADGPGSQVVLANVTNVVGFSDAGWWRFHSSAGGQVDLPSLQTLTNGWFDVWTTGTNSSVNLPALTSYHQGKQNQVLNLEADYGGTVQIPALVSLNHVGLTLRGPGSLMPLTQVSNIDNANLLATDGAVLAMPEITQVARTNGFDAFWEADGPGSRVLLANVTNVVGFSDGGWWRFHSSGGGQVDLPSLQTLSNGWFDVWTAGTNSSVNLPRFTSYRQGNQNQVLNLEADFGGTVQIPAMTSLNPVGLTLRGPGTLMPLAQVSNIDNANLLATDGAVLALPGINQVARTNGFDAVWEADGPGSQVVLANVTNVVGYSDGGWWRFHSSAGGQVDLPSLQTLTNGWFDVWTAGTNSLVDLSALTGYQPANQNQILDLEADYGGTVRIPSMTSLNHVGLTLRGPGSLIPLAQVSNVDNANFLATDGAVLALPGITQVSRTNGFDAVWEADGPGSQVLLANVTNVLGYSDGGWWRFHSLAGGQVDLPSLQTLTNGWFDVLADGTNSLIDLSHLTQYSVSRPDQYFALEALNGGTILIPSMVDLDRVNLTIRTASFISTTQIRSLTRGNVLLDGSQVRFPNLATTTGTTFSFLNGGSVLHENPRTMPLLLNQIASSGIPSAFGSDVWQFSEQAGDSIRLKIINVSPPQVYFTLIGPDNWIGFSDLTNDSDVVTLPTSGNYLLQVDANGSAVNYAFQLLQTAETDLLPGSTYTGQLVGTGQAQLFRLTLTNASPLLILLSNSGTGNRNEIYVKQGVPPTRGDFDYRFTDPGASQQVLVPTAAAGNWYVLVYSESLATPGPYSLSTSASDLILSAVAPNAQAANVPLVLGIDGAGFEGSLSVQLLSTNGIAYPAANLEVDTLNHMTASFPASTLPVGNYSVQVTKSGDSTATYSNAVMIVGSGLAGFQARLIAPSLIGFHIPSTLYIEYTNAGTVAMPAPLVSLGPTQEGRESTWLTLDPSRVISGYWTPANPTGYKHSVQFLAMGSTPGLLQPGESGRVAVYYAGIERPWLTVPVFWNLNTATIEDTNRINWDLFKSYSRPSTIASEAWDAIWPTLISGLGTNWGNYVQMLDDDASYLGRMGERVQNVSDLFNFELVRLNRRTPYRELANAEDAKIKAPGLPLVFARSFPSSMSGRFRMGALGRGWSHNWEFMLTNAPDGTVTVFGPAESRRVFQPDSRYPGVYFSSPGDHATLRLVSDHFELLEPDGLRRVFGTGGQLDYVADPNGNQITAAYNGTELATLTHSSGQALSFSYNGAGLITAIVGYGQPGDPVWTNVFNYDAEGDHLASVLYFDGRTASYGYELNPSSPSVHGLTNALVGCCENRFFSYDQLGRLQTTSLGDGTEALNLAYGAGGKLTITDALGNSQTLWFNERGLVVKTQNPLGSSTQFTFDGYHQLIRVTVAVGLTRTFAYDDRGDIRLSVDAVGNPTRFSFGGPFNRMTGLQDANLNQTQYRYDSRGNLQSVIYADNSTEGWQYDQLGSPLTWTNRRGQQLSYQYDTAGLLTNKLHSDGSRDLYQYDSRQNLTNATSLDSSGNVLYSVSFTYDAADRLMEITYPAGRTLSFTYDTMGRRLTSVDQTGHRLAYYYDSAGHLSSITNELNQEVVRYVYDLVGRLQQKRVGGSLLTQYAYDGAGQLLSVTNQTTTAGVISFFNYTYDSRGRRISMQTRYGSWAYGYDDLGQLVNAVLSSGDSSIPNRNFSCSYDPVGNRVWTIDNGLRTDYNVNGLNQYVQVGTNLLAYDADGNLTNELTAAGPTQYVFNDENRISEIVSGTDLWNYFHDPLGTLVQTVHNGLVSDLVSDPIGLGNVVGQYGSTQSVRYDYGLEVLTRTDMNSRELAFYAFDALGNTTEIVGSQGAVLNRYSYEPFGQATPALEIVPNPFQAFGASGVSSDGPGTLNMRARYYDPTIGRFISPDPLGLSAGDINLYRYVANAVTGSIDPRGTHPDSPPPPPIPPGPGPSPDDPPDGPPDAPPDCPSCGGGADPSAPHDPNSKTGPAGFSAAGFLPAGALLAYRTDFENDTNASVPAQQVFITDQLHTNLDWSTLRFTEVGFGDVFIPIPNVSHFETNVPMSFLGSNFVVQIEAGVQLASGQVYVVFHTIDPNTSLPPPVNIGFLPQEDGTGRGEGHVSYVVRAKADLTTGAEIRNVAVISFDNLPSIATNLKDVHNPSAGTDPNKECLNTIDSGVPSSLVQPLPATSQQAQFTVAWAGQDDPGGSGIEGYNIFVSADKGPWQLWLTNAAATTAEFQGVPGHTYAFLSQSIDNVGNIEPLHSTADAATGVALRPLGFSVVLSSTNLNVNGTFTYTLTVTNQGTSDATGIVLSNNIPAGLSLDKVAVSRGTFDAGAGWLVWSVGDLIPGGAGQMTLTLTALVSGALTNKIALTDASGTNLVTFNQTIPVQDQNPVLNVSLQNGLLLLTWPAAAVGFELQTTATLGDPAEWVPVGSIPVLNGDRESVFVVPASASQFFRLTKPH